MDAPVLLTPLWGESTGDRRIPIPNGQLCGAWIFAVGELLSKQSSCRWYSSLWLNDAICRHKPGSTLAQVMAWRLTAPSHYMNQCWFIILSSSGIHLRAISWDVAQPLIIAIENYLSKISFESPRSQWLTMPFMWYLGGVIKCFDLLSCRSCRNITSYGQISVADDIKIEHFELLV